MITNLPVEVILTISKHLNFTDKVNFMTTCKRLHCLIANTILYVNLDLMALDKDTDTILQKFECKALEGSQVKTLRLKTNYIFDPDIYSQLATLFPNVTRFINRKEGYHSNYTLHINKESVLAPMKRWIHTIEKYNMFSDWYFILPALRYHTFPRLTELKLGDAFVFKDKVVVGFDPLYFIPFIQHAPMLTTLRLWNCDINLFFLEQIHASCPHLKMLKCVSVVISIENETLPQPIAPAHHLSKLALNHVLIFDENGVLLDYIVSKYPHLYHLKLDIIDQEEYAEASLTRFYPQYSSEYKDTIHTKLTTFKTTFKTYSLRGSHFISRLPTTINVLKLKVAISENLLKDVSDAKLNPKTLKLQHRGRSYGNVFFDSHQIEYIQTLTQLRTFKAIIDYAVLASHRESVSLSVKQLHVQVSGDAATTLNLEWLLTMFPSLEQLYINYSAMAISGRGTRRFPRLHTLHITDCGIRQDFFPYLKSAAPNLTDLMLTMDNRSVIYYYTDAETLDHRLDVDLRGWQGLTRCSLFLENESLSGTHQFLCTIRMKGRSKRVVFFQRAVGYPEEEEEEAGNVTRCNVLCDEIKWLSINSYKVKLIENEVMVVL